MNSNPFNTLPLRIEDAREWIERVRKRPGMYVGPTDGRALWNMLVDLTVQLLDEPPGPACQHLTIAMQRDGGINVNCDCGEWLPAASDSDTPIMHKPADMVTRLVATLHHQPDWKNLYALALWRALSERLRLDVYQDGQHYRQEFARGVAVTDAAHIGPTSRTGLQLHAYPDQTIFSDLDLLSSGQLSKRLKILAALRPGVRISIHDERVFAYDLHFPAGLTDYLRTKTGETQDEPLLLHGQHEDVSVTLVWQLPTGGGSTQVESFVNGEPSEEHGSHVDGFWRGVRSVLKAYGKANGRGTPKNLYIPGYLVLAVNLSRPLYAAATRAELRDPRARDAVAALVQRWLPVELGKPGSGALLAAWLTAQEW